MNKNILISTIVVFIIVAGIVTWKLIDSSQLAHAPIPSSFQTPNVLMSPTPSISPTPQTTIQTSPIKESLLPQSSVDNCGIAGLTTFTGTAVEASSDTQKAWNCFTEHLQTCSRAKLRSESSTTEFYDLEIKGRTNSACTVLFTYKLPENIPIDPGSIKCNIPLKFISLIYTDVAQVRYPDPKFNFIKGTYVIGSYILPYLYGSKTTAYPNEEKINIDCVKQ